MVLRRAEPRLDVSNFPLALYVAKITLKFPIVRLTTYDLVDAEQFDDIGCMLIDIDDFAFGVAWHQVKLQGPVAPVHLGRHLLTQK